MCVQERERDIDRKKERHSLKKRVNVSFSQFGVCLTRDEQLQFKDMS